MKTSGKKIEYKCCFCANSIKSDDLDPSDLNISTHVFAEWDTRKNRSFYCHIACLKVTLHEDSRRYFVVDILGTGK